jgi:radical SAM superfamily enzyme YgiQ (UPF0313 family)
MKALLISTYEMGRQPFGLASPAAWLARAGWDVACLDVAKERFDEQAAASAQFVGFHLPMHTATRLAAPLVQRVRRLNPSATICAYGLYAPLNADWLRSLGVDHVLGGEFEEELVAVAQGAVRAAQGFSPANARGPEGLRHTLPRIHFLIPDRTGLPPLTRYAALRMPDGSRRTVGYTEASRGCKHLCRHCPIVPVYNGQFRVVQPDVVLADIDAQVDAGARHITFGDPDFLNGPAHALRIVETLHARHPGVTYDATIKVEHLLNHRDLLPRLAATGCAFVTSAVESVDDRVLAILQKGHTRAGFVEAVGWCREAGLTLVPTFVAFHPWLALDGYCDLLDTIAALGLVDHVAPIQLAIRLLVPQGSHLLALDEMRAHLGPFDPRTLTYRWSHPDSRVDALHEEIHALVGARINVDRRVLFDEISAIAHERAGLPAPDPRPARDRATVPYLNEPWYC